MSPRAGAQSRVLVRVAYASAPVLLAVLLCLCVPAVEPLRHDLELGRKCDTRDERVYCFDLACIDGKCNYCKTNDDCHESQDICVPDPTLRNNEHVCEHKDLFPVSTADIICSACLFVGAALAAGGGIGGGGVYVPLLIILLNFAQHLAIPLSSAMVFGGSLSNFALNAWKKHPHADRPLIDYDVALLMEPLTLAGSIIGVFLNIVLPEWLITVMLITVLSLTTSRTLTKGMQLWKKESTSKPIPLHTTVSTNGSDSHEMMLTDKEGIDDDDVKLTLSTTAPDDYPPLPPADHEDFNDDTLVTSQMDADLEAIYADERRQFPADKLVMLFFSWLVISLLTLFKGGHTHQSIVGVHPCTATYWLLVLLSFVFTFALTFVYTKRLWSTYVRKLEVDFRFESGDVKWTKKNTIAYPGMYMAAGAMAGVLGIGGGMIKGPLMLEMGMLPETTAATAAFMIMFTASSTTTQFLLMDQLKGWYALYLGVLGLVATIFGQVAVNWAVKKYRKTAFIVLCIALVIGISTILLGFSGAIRIQKQYTLGGGDAFGFNSIC